VPYNFWQCIANEFADCFGIMALERLRPQLNQEEAYPALVHGPLLEAHSEEQRSLAEILRILEAIQKAN
jgi:hypothetical protein